MGTGKAILGDIVRRQLSFIGHVLRKDKLEKLEVTGLWTENEPEADNERPFSPTYGNETGIANGTVTNG